MRRRVRLVVRPVILLLLLAGIASFRLTSGFPFDSIGSLERVVTHPSQHLEGGAYAEQKRQAAPHNTRRTMQAVDDPFKADGFTLKGSDVARTLSDSGGSFQLLLLLLLCATVLCCASMSISPWYKSDSYVLRKALALVHAILALVSEGVPRRPNSQQSSGDNVRSKGKAVQAEATGQPQAGLSSHSPRKGKAKKKKGSHPAPRSLETSASSSSHSSQSELAGSQRSVASVAELLPELLRQERHPGATPTPADLQIARLEAEAARQSSERAARSKQQQKKQVPAATVEIKVTPAPAVTEPPVAKQPPKQPPGKERERANSTRSGPPKPTKAGKDEEPRSKPARKAGGPEKTRLSQVLVVPRRQVARPRERSREKSASDEDREQPVAPCTPERAPPPPGSTTSSTHSSVFSPTAPSRPYAQVAMGTPPPVPLRRVGTLPQSAVFAQEFVPGGRLSAAAPSFSPSSRPELNPLPPDLNPLPRTPPRCLSPLPACPSQTSPPPAVEATSSALPSPFPGMSLRRRPMLPSEGSLDAGSSGLKGLSFPGVLDTIWSTGAAGQTSWSDLRGLGSAFASLESGRGFLAPLQAGGSDPWLTEPAGTEVSFPPGAAA